MRLRIVAYNGQSEANEFHVVCVHGFMGGLEDWAEVVASAPETLCMWGVELAGHGASPISPEFVNTTLLRDDSPATIRAQAHALVNTLRAHFAHPVHLVGYSMGGRIAARAALIAPECVASLVLESADLGLRQHRKERAALDDQRAHDLRTGGLQDFVERWYQAALFASMRDHPHLLRSVQARRSAEDSQQLAHVIQHASPGRTDVIHDAVCGLSCPKLWIVGARDPKYVALAKEMAERCTHNAALEIVPMAGHSVHTEAPVAFVEVLARFLHTHRDHTTRPVQTQE